MTRYEDWPERLNAFLESARPVKFKFGLHDCATFAAACVHELTGEKVGAAWLEAYSNAREAMRLIETNGLLSMVSESLGDPVSPLFARRGDIVLYQHPDHGNALAVCVGVDFAAPGNEFLEFAPMDLALHAWHVG